MLELLIILVMGTITALLSVATTLFWLWMLVDCIRNEPSIGTERLVWVLVIVFVPFIGSLLYYIARRPDRIQTYGH